MTQRNVQHPGSVRQSVGDETAQQFGHARRAADDVSGATIGQWFSRNVPGIYAERPSHGKIAAEGALFSS
jgi:hypothetical protein